MKSPRLRAAAVAIALASGLPAPPGLRAGQAFEVASVRPNNSGEPRVLLGLQPGGRFSATNVTARLLIRQAYDVQDFQIVGGPDWLGSDRFDVVAKAPDDTLSPELLRPMLRALLEDRFTLAASRETRDLPIYELVVARPDGALGQRLTPAAVDCAARRERRGGGPPPPLPQPGEPIECGMMMGLGRITAGGIPLAELARSLSPQVGRVVIDKTGLTATYDFQLTYAPEQLTAAGGPPLLNGGTPSTVDPDAPNLFTALQEQLGLKLESRRGPVDVVVVERLERPEAD